MSASCTPGARRLFPVEPTPQCRYEIVTADATVIARTGDLAVAVIATTAAARRRHQPAWLTALDRWSVRIAATTDGWDVTTDEPTSIPIDAIRRVLTHLPTEEHP